MALQRDPRESREAESSSSSHPYSVFSRHATGTNNTTGLAVLQAIRAHHPQQLITPFSDDDFDVLGWAKASDDAELLSVHSPSESFVKREYRLQPSGVAGRKHEGQLADHVVFGRWCLKWKGEVYDLYAAEWEYSFMGRTTRLFYLASPPTNHCDDRTNSTPGTDALLLTAGKWTASLHNEIFVFDSGHWDKDSHLCTSIKSCCWSDIVLDASTKETIAADVHDFFDSRELYRAYAVPWKRGIIFHGSPGCGKTMSIKALMNSVSQRADHVSCLVVRRMDSTCIEPQDGMHMIFQRARAMAPCVLVLEDLDSLVTGTTRSYFLNEVDGLEDNNGILMIGSTNHLERLDAGISKRPSRFDRKYHFKVPDLGLRRRHCEMWRGKLEENGDVEFGAEVVEMVARMTEGFSFAYLKELLVQSLLAMARRHAKMVAENAHQEAVESGGVHSIDEKGLDDDGVPEDLRSNPFAQVLRRHIVSLKGDMESADDEQQENGAPPGEQK